MHKHLSHSGMQLIDPVYKKCVHLLFIVYRSQRRAALAVSLSLQKNCDKSKEERAMRLKSTARSMSTSEQQLASKE